MSSSPPPEASNTKRSRKPKGPKTKPSGTTLFSEQQTKWLKKELDNLEDLLIKHNIETGKDDNENDPEEIRDWFYDTKNRAMHSPEFASLSLEDKTRDQWKEVGNSHLVQKPTQQDSGEKTQGTSLLRLSSRPSRHGESRGSAEGPAEERPALPLSKALQKLAGLRREIREETKRLREEEPELANGNNGGLHKLAVSNLWEALSEEEKASYAEKSSQSNDPSSCSNQQAFGEGIFALLYDIAKSGALGNMEVVVYAGFRDNENAMAGSIYEVSSRCLGRENKKFFKDNDGGVKDSVVAAWGQWCARVIKCKAPLSPKLYQVTDCHKVNPRGPKPVLDPRLKTFKGSKIPTLQGVDVDNTTFTDLMDMLESLLDCLWYLVGFGSSLPYDDIAKHPECYYDTKKFKLPIALAPPRTLQRHERQLLVDFLVAPRDDTFVFLPQSTGRSANSTDRDTAPLGESQVQSVNDAPARGCITTSPGDQRPEQTPNVGSSMVGGADPPKELNGATVSSTTPTKGKEMPATQVNIAAVVPAIEKTVALVPTAQTGGKESEPEGRVNAGVDTAPIIEKDVVRAIPSSDSGEFIHPSSYSTLSDFPLPDVTMVPVNEPPQVNGASGSPAAPAGGKESEPEGRVNAGAVTAPIIEKEEVPAGPRSDIALPTAANGENPEEVPNGGFAASMVSDGGAEPAKELDGASAPSATSAHEEEFASASEDDAMVIDPFNTGLYGTNDGLSDVSLEDPDGEFDIDDEDQQTAVKATTSAVAANPATPTKPKLHVGQTSKKSPKFTRGMKRKQMEAQGQIEEHQTPPKKRKKRPQSRPTPVVSPDKRGGNGKVKRQRRNNKNQ
ncbi:hypothetical protein AAF712_001166 [Marasmius tenuissimus]|uniref:Uncharacterized protein n=1 Tax=Marasmius tenuissimus TaxID=585030 RepID=A0ABR3AD60_9AGAR